jgi:transcriptional regulator with XRE-family HTH domain
MADHHLLADEVWMRGIANLRAEVVERGLNYSALSRQAGVHHDMVYRITSGDGAGSMVTQRAIANALGRDPGLFFPRNELELVRAEALRTLDDRDRTVGQLRAQAQALAEAADTIEGLVAP